MKYTLDWLTDPEVFAVNRIAAHSDHRIYANHLEADADNSSLIQNLNGTWKFAWAKNPSEWQQKFYEESDSTDNFDNIQVPGHMELQGYGKPQYVNTIYPWEGQEHLRPPFISEKDNSVGSYVRYFDLNDALKNKRVFISFQGVETAMYVWLNGEFIGYSEDSFTPSEFELTPYIREKDNKLAVAVFKRSSASWLEDQDFWRFSGIFRDIFLYAAPSAHVGDMRVIADYDGTNGIFSATLDIAGKCSVRSILTDENGTVIAQSNEKESVNWTIENSKPWSAEIPNLYTFTVILTDEDGNEIRTMELEELWSENQIQVIKTVLEKDQVIFELEETCLDDTVRYKTTIPVVWFYTALLDDNVWEGEEFYVSRKNGETWLTISGRVGPKQNSVRLLDAVQTHEMTYNIRRTKKEDGVYIIETGHNVYAYTPAPEYFIEVWSEKDKMFLILPTPKDAPELYGWEMPQHLACK